MIFLAIGRDCPFKSMALLKNKGSGQFESLMEFIMLVDTTLVNSIDLRTKLLIVFWMLKSLMG